MKNWLKALWAETVLSVWWILSALSTLSTFFFLHLSDKWRVVLAASTLFGFALANFRVFVNQERQISALGKAAASKENRISSLRISGDNRSRYILVPLNNVPGAEFNGMFVEFHLMIENMGSRNSTVTTYAVAIVELHRSFGDLRPEEGRDTFQGRHCQFGSNRATGLSDTGVIKIDAERSTNRGTLRFFLPDVTLEHFVSAGLQMHGKQRKFGTLHCRLTVWDTTSSSASEDFQMDEA